MITGKKITAYGASTLTETDTYTETDKRLIKMASIELYEWVHNAPTLALMSLATLFHRSLLV